MRFKLALAVAIAVLAATAPSAGATNAVQVVDEGTGSACTAVTPTGSPPNNHTTGGCTVHAAGTILLETWSSIFFFWPDEATCQMELELRIGSNGLMAVDDVDFYNGDANCQSAVVSACDLPWETTSVERDTPVPNTSHMFGTVMQVCLLPAEVGAACLANMSFDMVETEGTEVLKLVLFNTEVANCRLSGDLTVEASQQGNTAIHIN